MKEIILSTDNGYNIYSVPDAVADDLDRYCLDFCNNWLKNSPDAEKYRTYIYDTCVYIYTEADFIEYLNRYLFPDEPSHLICNIDMIENDILLDKYKNYPRFEF